MLKATIAYADTAYSDKTKDLSHYVVNLDHAESVRIQKMLDADVIKCNSVFRCETTVLGGQKREVYVNMLHVRQISFREE